MLYAVKCYVLNQNWNQADSDLYTQLFGNLSLIPNCRPDLYQFYKSSSKTCHSYCFDTVCAYWCDTVLMLQRYWFSSFPAPRGTSFGFVIDHLKNRKWLGGRDLSERLRKLSHCSQSSRKFQHMVFICQCMWYTCTCGACIGSGEPWH